MKKHSIAVSTLALAGAFALIGLTPSHAQSQTSGAAVASGSAHATPAPALDDPTIVAIFDAANTWDVEAGRLALQKSHNKDVRTFAQMMVRDHKAVRQLGRDLAKKLNVTPTPPGKDFPLAVAQMAAMKTLHNSHGAAFDKAYIDHEVAYHQAVIDAITTTLLPATKNAELRQLETQVAPNFQAHLVAAKNVQKELASR